ncbi:MAG TPA: hypothetical protein VLV78_21215 [Thermoanaerobaculia bacterium]|nr:hypothetical protein [Thermoanaerobaculia bacterium]
MKLAIAILCVAVIALAILLNREFTHLRQVEHAVQQLNSNKAQETASESLELQAKCSAQARKEFEYEGLAKKDMAGYESHYSPELKRCFVATSLTDAKTNPKVIWTTRSVYDAFEGKEYATYVWHTVEGKKYWEVPPFQCEVTLPSGEKKICHSDDEFNELIQPYMGGALTKKTSFRQSQPNSALERTSALRFVGYLARAASGPKPLRFKR